MHPDQEIHPKHDEPLQQPSPSHGLELNLNPPHTYHLVPPTLLRYSYTFHYTYV